MKDIIFPFLTSLLAHPTQKKITHLFFKLFKSFTFARTINEIKMKEFLSEKSLAKIHW
jgi:hypothetical protein